MDGNGTIQVVRDISHDQLHILHRWLDHIECCDTMQLLSFLVYVHVESDIVISEIFDFGNARYDLVVVRVEQQYFPQIDLLDRQYFW